jgi:hypothetical protein
VDQAQEKTGQVVDQVKQQATTQISTQKDRAVDTLSSVAQAIRQTGRQLQDQDQSAIGQYANKAADQIERISGYLQHRDVNQIVREAEGFARREPALFLGGAFALGIFAARFLKSSSRQANAGGYSSATGGQYASYPSRRYETQTFNTPGYATPGYNTPPYSGGTYDSTTPYGSGTYDGSAGGAAVEGSIGYGQGTGTSYGSGGTAPVQGSTGYGQGTGTSYTPDVEE